MPDIARLGRTISLSAARVHDRLCDQFESGWQAGSPPRIEDLLNEVSADQQPDLFVALLRVELEFRQTPAADGEYQARFPQFALLVEQLLRDPAGLTMGMPAFSAELAPPPSIEGYEIFGPIGAGGMGIVYRARHVALDRAVAIKTVRPGAFVSRDFLLRFHREARAVAALNHPGVVQLYAFGQVDDLPYYVMEFVDGGSLDDRLDGRPMDPDLAARLVEQLADIIQYVHDQGIVHRDLKPANILLTGVRIRGSADIDPGTLTPKVADFGLAKRLDGAEPGITHSRTVIGTACYMAPEQASGNKQVGKPADIHALGAILFELLTGRPPFHAPTYEMTVVQVMTEEPPRPAELVPGLSPDLEAVCLKCLEKDPANRYATAGDLAADLRRWRKGEAPRARPLPARERDSAWARRIGYDITGLLGRNGWSRLYTAVQSKINRKVVLKLSTGRVGSRQHEALERCAAVLPHMDHPNVLRLLDYGEQHGQPYLVLDHVEGAVVLSRLLRDEPVGGRRPDLNRSDTVRRPLAPARAGEVCLTIALGLQEIHERGVLHCGLNSDCIILNRDLAAKITGFEAACKLNEPLTDNLTPSPEVVPAAFVAPELLANRPDRVGRHTDVYGLGAILYDLLTGQPPFAAATPEEMAEQVLDRPPVPPREVEPTVPPPLEAICLRCLEKNPANRYPTAGAVALELQRFLRPAEPGTNDTTVGPSDVDARAGPAGTFQVRVVSGPAKVGECILLARQQVKIGRTRECEVFLPGDKISRLHCGIVWNDGARRHELMDYGAKNGSFVNGERVKGSRLLTPGDLIQLPDFVLKFEAAE